MELEKLQGDMSGNKKPCRGIGRAKGVSGCGKPSDRRQNGLCPVCLMEWATETEAGKLWKVQVFDPRVEKASLKAEKEREKELRDNLTDWRSKLQERVQEIARLVDIGLPCLALGYHAGRIHGGHIFSKGGNRTISLNLHNIHRQSAQSNHSHNDDGLMREKLMDEYGKGYYEFLSSMRQCPALKYTNQEYMNFYKLANDIANLLKKEGKNYDMEARIALRNEINLSLGIYPEKYCVYEHS